MSLRFIPLASSSLANSFAVQAADTIVIVDAGITRSDMRIRLTEQGILTPGKRGFDALLLTHEHGDHAAKAYEWLKFQQPVFATAGAAEKLGIDEWKQYRKVTPFQPIQFQDVVMTAFPIPHNAAEPVAWRIAHGGKAVVIATDLGSIPEGFDRFIRGATDLFLEANYHPNLLELCDYPQMTKDRIGSDVGHLSVIDAAAFIERSLPPTIERIWLGHLSRKCCDPKIVRHLATKAIGGRNIELTVLEK